MLSEPSSAGAGSADDVDDDESTADAQKKKEDPFRELQGEDTYQLPDTPCLLLGFRWDTTSKNAVCDLDAVAVFFDHNANALALVDCVQDTYSNVCSLIDDSVYNMEGCMEEDLEKMMLDLTRVDKRVTTIVTGVRSMSMTFKAHSVSAIKCVCASLRFRRFSNEGRVDLAPAWHQRAVSSSLLFSAAHEPRKDQQNNVVTLFMLSRPNARTAWTATTIYEELRCGDTTALKHVMSGYVASPSISAVALALPTIPALCAALTSKALPQMKNKFFAEGNSRGLARIPFVHAVFMHLYQTTKGLHAKADAARVVAMLDELFDQIDINGNDYVDWEEFTSFCIELGIISGKGTNNAAFQPDDFSIEYHTAQRPGGAASSVMTTGTADIEDVVLGPGVAFMTYVPEVKHIYYANKESNTLKALDTTGKPHHQHEFLDPYFVEGQHVTVHTVAHIPGRYLAVVCSDHSVNLMKEVKNRRGCTHGYHCEAKVMHQLMHTRLMWEPCFQKLISVGSDNHLYQWQLEDMAAGAQRIFLRPEHANTITDIVCIAEKELVVTSSLDRRVCVWQMPTWKLRACFRDHALGVQVLSYLRGTLLSAGFDWEIIAWDAERLEKIGTMAGHKAPVTAVAQMVCPTNYEDMKAVSADCTYETRVWDLSGCIAGGNTIPCLMVFKLPGSRSNPHGPKQLCLPFDQELSVKGYSNILVGGQNIASYAALKIKKEFFVPPAAEYNSSSAHFLSALRQNVHIWDATSGEYVRKLTNVSPNADVVSACFALPFERRLLLGTEDGRILLVNYITGAVLDESHPHSAEVTQMVYCEGTKVVISADCYGMVVVTSEIQCKLKELRKVRDIYGRGTAVAHMAYSYRLSKIVTCSTSAEVQVLGFQHLDFVAAAVQSAGEPSTGLAFLDKYSIVVIGDLTRVCLWHLDMDSFKMTCFCKLTLPALALGLPMDVLNSLGVLRSEQCVATSTTARRSNTEGEQTPHSEGSDSSSNEDEYEDKTDVHAAAKTAAAEGVLEPEYDEGEVFIALGTERGRLACWALEDIMRCSMELLPNKQLKPVPDSLCPALGSSFNPYSLTVKLRTTNQEAAVNTITDNTDATRCGDSGTTTRTGSIPAGGIDNSPRTTGGGVGSRTCTSDGNGAVSASGARSSSPRITGGGAGAVSGGYSASGSRTGGGIGSVASGENGRNSASGGNVSGCGGDNPGGDTVGGDSYSFEEDDAPCLIPEAAPPRAVWRGHAGPVARIGSCSQPPCFFTLGEDGYQRTWSVDGKVLGQFALPNASEFHLKHRLFRNPGWVFLVDAVRVRPYHEEMTTTLLEEVEKHRVNQKEHSSSKAPTGIVGSTTVVCDSVGGGGANAASVEAATASTGVVGGSSVASITHKNSLAPLPPEAYRGAHGQNRGAGLVAGGSDMTAFTFTTLSENETSSSVVHREVAAPAVAGGNMQAERKRLALATIEQFRSNTASGVREQAGSHLPCGRSYGKRLSSTTPRTSGVGKFKLSEAFSAQSVRFGATLGYYGREEMDALFAISKNPSRVAAYNRIVLGKDGGREDEKVGPEVDISPISAPRRRRRTVGESASAPALLSGAENNKKSKLPLSRRSVCSTAPSLSSSSSPAVSLLRRQSVEPGEDGLPVDLVVEKNELEGAEGWGGEWMSVTKDLSVSSVSPSSQSPPSRAVKMYRNAAREFRRGYSAGQAIWKDLQSDPSARAICRSSRRSSITRRDKLQRGDGRPRHGAPVAADWTSSTLLELPEIETAYFGGTQDRDSRRGEKRRERSGPVDQYENGDDAFGEQNWGSSGGDVNLGSSAGVGRDVNSAASDWFDATRDHHEDGTGHDKRLSLTLRNGRGGSHGHRRRAARRCMAPGSATGEKAPRGTSVSTTTPPQSEKWDWDWCRRPVSALPARRVDALLGKIDDAVSAGGGGAAGVSVCTTTPVAVNADKASEEGEAQGGRRGSVLHPTEGGADLCPTVAFGARGNIPEVNESALLPKGRSPGSCSRGGEMVRGASTFGEEERGPAMTNRSGLGPKGDGSGVAHLVSADTQKRKKQLARVEQKIIALLVKGNGDARRREAQERRRGHKASKKPLAKGPRPGQLGPHYTLQAVMDFRAAFNFVDEDMSGCLDSEEWRRFLDRFKSNVAAVNMRSMFLHLDKDMSGTVEVGELIPVIFNKASPPQHHLMRHLIEYENAVDAKKISSKSMLPTGDHPETLQLKDAKELFDLYDTSGCSRLEQTTIRRVLLALRVPQLSWDAFARSVPRLQISPDASLTADEFAAGFFEAFVL